MGNTCTIANKTYRNGYNFCEVPEIKFVHLNLHLPARFLQILVIILKGLNMNSPASIAG
jgi:hypothetical protein